MCYVFVAKKGLSFVQGSGVFSETFAYTVIECASLCDRDKNCVSFEYTEGAGVRHCRLSGRYVNELPHAAGNLPGGTGTIYELVSIRVFLVTQNCCRKE